MELKCIGDNEKIISDKDAAIGGELKENILGKIGAGMVFIKMAKQEGLENL